MTDPLILCMSLSISLSLVKNLQFISSVLIVILLFGKDILLQILKYSKFAFYCQTFYVPTRRAHIHQVVNIFPFPENIFEYLGHIPIIEI
jgi:hypothetical protein